MKRYFPYLIAAIVAAWTFAISLPCRAMTGGPISSAEIAAFRKAVKHHRGGYLIVSIKPNGVVVGQPDDNNDPFPPVWIHVKPAFKRLSNSRQREIIEDWFKCWRRICRPSQRYAALYVQIQPNDIYGQCDDDDPCILESDPERPSD